MKELRVCKAYWYIKCFDDYHEIIHHKGRYKAIELGCWMPENGCSYNLYYGLFYKGRKPTFQKVFNKLLKMVLLNDGDPPFMYLPGITKEELACELKEVLK